MVKALGLSLGIGGILALSVAFAGESPRDAAAVLEADSVPRVPSVLTLDDALGLASEWSPALTDASWQLRAAESLESQADRVPNPGLDLRFSELGERGNVEDISRRRIILSQDLELGGKRSRRLDLARIESRLAEQNHRSRSTEVAAMVAAQFAEVLGAQQRVELNREFAGYIEKLHGIAMRMVDTGLLRSVEVQLIAQRFGEARIALQRAESDLASHRFGLVSIWGSSAPDFERAAGELELAGSLPDLDVLLDMIQAEASPSSVRWEAQMARSRAELSLAKAGAVPDLEFGLGVVWEEDGAPPDYLVDLEIDIPLFDRNGGAIRAARADLQRTQALRKTAEALDSRLVAEVYYDLSASAARSSILQDEVIPAARAVAAALRLGFEGQAEGLDDLLDARRYLIRTEIDRIEALVDYRRLLAELEHLLGQPLHSPQ